MIFVNEIVDRNRSQGKAVKITKKIFQGGWLMIPIVIISFILSGIFPANGWRESHQRLAFRGRKILRLAGVPVGGTRRAAAAWWTLGGEAGERFAGQGNRVGAPQGQVMDSNAGPGEGRTRHPILSSLSSPFTFGRLTSPQTAL